MRLQRRPGRNGIIGKYWAYRFLERHALSISLKHVHMYYTVQPINTRRYFVILADLIHKLVRVVPFRVLSSRFPPGR